MSTFRERRIWLRVLSGFALLPFIPIATGAALQLAEHAPSADAVPTFARDVAPILYAHCVRCHNPAGTMSSLPLLDYDVVRRKAREIRDAVVARQMPPWPADSGRSLPFSNDPRLSEADIDTVVSWVDADAPLGDPADRRAGPAVGTGWLHPAGRAPDSVVSLPQYTVAANGVVPYIQHLIKVPFNEDKWITALQVRPGNPRLLHHMGITEVELPDGMTPETIASFDRIAKQIGAPSGALQVQRPAVEDIGNQGAYDMLGIYTPGTTFESYGDGNGKLLKGGANTYINFNMHFTTTGKEETDRTQLALWFSESPPSRQLYRMPAAVRSIIANGRELLTDDPGTKAEGTDYAVPPILANADHYELIGLSAYERAITVYQLQPHAHVRAADFKYVAVYPDGREITLLTVPQYDYHFQLAYALATPLRLPAGSKIIVTGHYNNSPSNPQLRHLGDNEAARKCGPDNVAYFGQQNQSWDEMFSPFIQYSVDPASAPPLPVVAATGCALHSPDGSWQLIHGSKPAASREQGTSAAELLVTSRMRSGQSRYRLLGADVFNPDQFNGTGIVVKGVLVAARGGAGINVTSMQRTGMGCPR